MKQKLNDKEKLSQILTFFGLNFSDFATKIGVPNAKIYDVSSERIKFFGRDTMEQIAKSCPEISPYWLITGEGSMLGGTVEQHNVNGDNIGQQNNRTDNGDLMSRRRFYAHARARMLSMVIGNEALKPANGNALALYGANAFLLALALLRTYAPTDGSKRGAFVNNLISSLKIPIGDLGDKIGDSNPNRASADTGLILAS